MSLTTDAEIRFAHALLTETIANQLNFVHIGINDIDEEGRFMWSDGSPALNVKWYNSFDIINNCLCFLNFHSTL